MADWATTFNQTLFTPAESACPVEEFNSYKILVGNSANENTRLLWFLNVAGLSASANFSDKNDWWCPHCCRFPTGYWLTGVTECYHGNKALSSELAWRWALVSVTVLLCLRSWGILTIILAGSGCCSTTILWTCFQIRSWLFVEFADVVRWFWGIMMSNVTFYIVCQYP